MRRLLCFCIYVTGVLFAVDAAFFDGQHRTDAWRGVTYKVHVFNLDVQSWLRKSLW